MPSGSFGISLCLLSKFLSFLIAPINWPSHIPKGQENWLPEAAIFASFVKSRILLQKIFHYIILSFSFQPKGKKVLRNLSYVLCQVEVLAFLFAFLMAGILWGYLENFLFWHLEDLGATKFLMGTYWKIYYLSEADHVFFSLWIFEFECMIISVISLV